MPPVHPAIVHFPIALLVLSVFADLFGYIYTSDSLRGAGWWSLAGANVYAAATAITQTTYGATQHEDRPHAVTLVRADRQADAMLAASRVTHFPVNSPVLYVDADRLPEETFNELKRLGPDGNIYDSNVQVYLVGAISDRVEREVIDKLGYKTRAFRIDDPIALSEELDTWAADVHTDHPDEAIIVQYNQLNTGLPAVAWNAHMGHGLFFVEGDTIPDATRRALSRRFQGEAFVYLFGDESLISENIARQLSQYGHVQRIPGRDAFEIAANFAGYRDAGANQGYWINWWARDFGWGIAEAGHNFTFVNADDWQQAVTGSVLSHMGKHGPMIFSRPEGLDEKTTQYLEMVRPSWGAANDQLNNHGWILGGTDRISWKAQADIDLLLNPKENSR
ncbi:MAG TPA: DUF2231 domain-containing protein [Pyrinomonadaceae bacterium]|nr:DUF2231 domain-containing protein [Pyrinomonadaceae bacterium]